MKKYHFILFVSLSLFSVGCRQSSKVQEQQDKPVLIGGDKDEHGCLASAGYVWSEVSQDCIRLFEKGVSLKSVDGKSSVYIVFAPDSLKAELFFSDKDKSEVLDRRVLPTGEPVWNVEDDDTYNVRFMDGGWTISQRGKMRYQQIDSSGKIITQVYKGILSSSSDKGEYYLLKIEYRQFSGDGRYALEKISAGGEKELYSSGKRYTLRGTSFDNDATVWQFISNKNEEIINFLVKDSVLILLNKDFQIQYPAEKYVWIAFS